MIGEDLPRDAELNEVRSQLNQGLSSCRAVVANYRAFLAGEPHAEMPVNDDDPPAAGDGAAQPRS